MRQMHLVFPISLRALTAAVVLSFASVSLAGKIEATKDKRYELTKQHGPWMIMVATFHTTAADGESDEGKSPEQAADDLVYELRTRNLPAYVYQMTGDEGLMTTTDSRGRLDRRKNLRKATSWGVIAGNYPSLDDELAQKTLDYIKALKPKCLSPEEGVVWYAKQGQGPLHNAFLSPNPLLSHEEVVAREQELGARGVDTLLVKLNSNENYSLLENKGKYTLQVAMFSGRRMVEGTGTNLTADNHVGERIDPLHMAGFDAQAVALALREEFNIEAYVWHDHYQSIVTVGSYDSPADPRMKSMFERFRAKRAVDPARAGQGAADVAWVDQKGNNGEVTRKALEYKPEIVWVNHRNKDGVMTRMPLGLMATPLPIEVPRLKPRTSIMARASSRNR